MAEVIRGRNLPPPPVASTHGIQLIGEATKEALSPVEQIAHTVLDRVKWEMRQGHPGKRFYRVQGNADLGLAHVEVEMIVRVHVREPIK